MVFVAKGCLRSYVTDDRGKVHIVGFAPEDWWLSDSARFLSGAPSTLFIDAIEPSDLLVIDHPSHQRILDGVPGYAAAYQVGLQRLAAAKDKRIIGSLSASLRTRTRASGVGRKTHSSARSAPAGTWGCRARSCLRCRGRISPRWFRDWWSTRCSFTPLTFDEKTS
jgi:hypothetical protein